MTTLLAVGLGYSARQLIATDPGPFTRVIGTSRTEAGAAIIGTLGTPDLAVEGLVFDGTTLTAPLADAIAEADVLLLSAPPEAEGDPLLVAGREALRASPRLKQILYLTTLGVYGDHQGAWVDETTVPRAGSARLERRLAAEAGLQAFGRDQGIPVAVLRLAGIYGPGRNVLRQVARGEARRIDKPDQVFNRIHVDDIAGAIRAAVAHRFDGIVNVTDDLPAPPGDPIAFAAELLGVAPPPAVPFAEAAREMSPMALTFWASNKRVRNGVLTHTLGVKLLYPTYREGLSALHAEGDAA